MVPSRDDFVARFHGFFLGRDDGKTHFLRVLVSHIDGFQ